MNPVLIVGAGIVGLTLGQALKKKGIPFEVSWINTWSRVNRG